MNLNSIFREKNPRSYPFPRTSSFLKLPNTCATFIFLTMITIDIYIYIQYEVLESTVSSCSLRIELTFDEKLGQAVISKRCAGTRKKEKSYEAN